MSKAALDRVSRSIVVNAASRIRRAQLEKERTYRVYKQFVKEAKNSSELEGDLNFLQLRSEMQTAKLNHVVAQQVYEAVVACPPEVK